MRSVVLLLAGAAFVGSPADAADKLSFGPAPTWVVAQAIPQKPTNATDAPAAILLHDGQIRFESGKITTFIEIAVRLQTPQGLSAGNIAFPWQPAFDTVTVNKLHIIRDGKVIDVLGSGQTFTIARRETNLDAATLDGTLTAALQPEGLQVGDIIDFAMTGEHVDPTLKGHVEASFADWNGLPVEFGHVRLSWPTTTKLITHQTSGMPIARQFTKDGFNVLELESKAIEPLILPKSAPIRYQIGRLGEASDFSNWGNLADLFRPLFRDAAIIPPTGDLRDELERIRKQGRTPKERTEFALQLVEKRVRYVALAMGTGGLVPASAETTWSRRFGDCKAKSALLVALLHELGIEAEPALVNHKFGDALPERLPRVDDFDHVIVRAQLGAKTYWLDPTRSGDMDLDKIPAPDFEWGLPLVEHAKLVAIDPKPLAVPEIETSVAVDASGGVLAPAPFTAEQVMRGDDAIALNGMYLALPSAQLDAALKQYWRSKYDYVDITAVKWSFDEKTPELRLSMTGTARLHWNDGWLFVPESTIAYKPDFVRAAGPFHDAPFAASYPSWGKTHVEVRLPDGFAEGQKKMPAPVNESLAGVEYQRAIRLEDSTLTVETSERSLQPEVPYKTALADEPRLRALYDDDVYLRLPDSYRPTKADLAALPDRKPGSASEFVTRGNMYLDSGKFDEAIADFSEAHRLDPDNRWAIPDRAIAHVWKREFAEANKDLAAAQAADPDSFVVFRARALMAELNGDFKGAADYYTRSLVGDADNSFALTHRALALANLQKFDEAIRDLTTVVEKDPESAPALARRSLIYAQIKNLDAAEKDVAAALAIDPGNMEALRARAYIAEQRGDHRGAIAAYTAALVKSPGDPAALQGRAEAYHAAGEDEKALADIDVASKAGPLPPQARLLRANVLRNRGEHNLVIAEAELLMKENPQSDFALVAAGKILSAEGQREKALQAMDRALAVHPASFIYVNRSQVRAPSDFAGRLADLDEALKLQPNMPEALQFKAWILLRQKKYEEAIAAFDLAIANDPLREAELQRGRAVALYKAGKTAEAEKQLGEIRAKATEPGDFNALCWDSATSGILLESALEDCRRAVKLRPNDASYKDSLGMVLLRLGRLDEAIAAYSQAIAKARLPASFMGRAIAYATKGEVKQAQADRAKALNLYPDVEDEFAEYGLRFSQAETTAVAH